MLVLPFPYIANTAGWMTAEMGRQPWLIYGLMRTAAGLSAEVSAGNALFTLLGFMGMYMVLAILFLFLIYREIEHGPERWACPRRSTLTQEIASLRRQRIWKLSGSVWSRHDRRLRGAGRLRSRRRDRAFLRGAAPSRSDGACCSPSGRSGTATRSGCWPAAAPCTSPFPRSMPRASAASTCR